MRFFATPAGDFRTPLTLRVPSVGPAAPGGTDTVQTYRDGRTVWAAVHPLTGREQLGAGQVQATQLYRLRLRFDATLGLSVRHRLKTADGRDLEISSVIDVEDRHAEYEIMAAEAVR